MALQTTVNQFGSMPFSRNLVANLLVKPDRQSAIRDLSGGFNDLPQLIDINTAPRQIVGQDGKYEFAVIGVSAIVAQVASATLVGTSLVINFTDPNYDNFRLKEVVSDGTALMPQGKVTSHAAGTITITPAEVGLVFNPAIHFVAGSYVTVLYNAQANRGSTGMETQYEYPTWIENQTGVMRENLKMFRNDWMNTWVEQAGDYWYFPQQMYMLKRWTLAKTNRYIWDKFGTIGGDNHFRGIKEAIQSPVIGGFYQAMTSVMTQADFENFINRVAENSADPKQKLQLYVGRGKLAEIQAFTTPLIIPSGKRNTFGGETVKGLDVYDYSINGIECELLIAPKFNDKTRFPGQSAIPGSGAFSRQQYTMIALDFGTYKTQNGGEAPALESTCFDPMGRTTEHMYYTPGVAMEGVLPNGGSPLTQGDFALAVSQSDATEIGIYQNFGVNCVATHMGMMERVI